MRKNCLLLILFILPLVARAERYKLQSMTCRGNNSVILELDPENNTVVSKLGFFTKTFGTTKDINTFITPFGRTVSRLILSKEGQSNVFLYDIYLYGELKLDETQTLKGVIGKTVHTVIWPTFMAPVPVPVGFVPTTGLTCKTQVN
jgi:hypothetical protein